MIGQHPHNTSGNQPYTPAQGILIAWANVGKNSSSHITILQLAWETKVDVVCVQEPFTCLDISGVFTSECLAKLSLQGLLYRRGRAVIDLTSSVKS
jgi:hypothetical protein